MSNMRLGIVGSGQLVVLFVRQQKNLKLTTVIISDDKMDLPKILRSFYL